LIVQLGVRNGSARQAGQAKRLLGSKRAARHINTVLVEVYRSSADPTEHKKTAYYQTWRNTVAEMMTEPCSSIKYANVFPDDAG
jgi:hypothetical protein